MISASFAYVLSVCYPSIVTQPRDPTLDALLDLDGQVLVVDPEGGRWVRFVVTRVPVSQEKPRGLDYSLTLQSPDGERWRKVGRVVVVGFRCGGEAFVKGKCRGEVTRNAEATPLQPHYIANTQCGTRRCQVTASRRQHSPQVFAGPAAASHGAARCNRGMPARGGRAHAEPALRCRIAICRQRADGVRGVGVRGSSGRFEVERFRRPRARRYLPGRSPPRRRSHPGRSRPSRAAPKAAGERKPPRA